MTTVLIIDDSSFQRKWLSQSLQNLGFEVVQAENGRQGLEMVAQKTPCFITVDLNMPVMDGLQFLAKLKSEDRTIPAIVVTSDIQAETERQCKELGAVAFLNKPFKLDELKDIINSFSLPKQARQ